MYILKAIKFVLSKIFDRKNITGPLGLLSKLILGTNVLKPPRQMTPLQRTNFEMMSHLQQQIKQQNNKPPSSLIWKLIKASLNFI